MIKYSEQWDAYYDDVTNEWTESKCDDPTCEYCAGRPEKPMDGVMVTTEDKLNDRIRELMIEAGYAAPELAGRARKFATLLIESIVADLDSWKDGYDDRAAFNLHEIVGHIQERIRGF